MMGNWFRQVENNRERTKKALALLVCADEEDCGVARTHPGQAACELSWSSEGSTQAKDHATMDGMGEIDELTKTPPA
jgi:hypothetical protein